MKLISICMLLVLTSCGILVKNEDAIKKIGHDAVDESVDEVLTGSEDESQ